MLIKSKNNLLFYNTETLELKCEDKLVAKPEFIDNSESYFFEKRSKYPWVIQVFLGSQCNMRCKYCIQGLEDSRKHDFKEIDIDLFLKNLEKAYCFDNLISLELWGGEPLIYWEYIQKIILFIDEKLDHQVPVSIISNGKLLTKDKVEWLNNNSKNLYFIIALTHDGISHEKDRGYSWLDDDSVIASIKQMIKNRDKFWVAVACTLSENNFKLCENNDWFEKKLKEKGIDDYQWDFGSTICRASDGEAEERTITSLEEFKKEYNRYIDLCLDKNYRNKLFFKGTLLGIREQFCKEYTIIDLLYFVCGQKRNNRYFTVPYPECPAIPGHTVTVNLYSENIICPHIQQSLGPIEERNNFVEKGLPFESCNDCEIKYLCEGICPKLKTSAEEKTCALQKVLFKLALQRTLDLLEEYWIQVYDGISINLTRSKELMEIFN